MVKRDAHTCLHEVTMLLIVQEESQFLSSFANSPGIQTHLPESDVDVESPELFHLYLLEPVLHLPLSPPAKLEVQGSGNVRCASAWPRAVHQLLNPYTSSFWWLF
jgi:hypothetical protein